MIFCAFSISSFEGAKHSWIILICRGWIQPIPSKPSDLEIITFCRSPSISPTSEKTESIACIPAALHAFTKRVRAYNVSVASFVRITPRSAVRSSRPIANATIVSDAEAISNAFSTPSAVSIIGIKKTSCLILCLLIRLPISFSTCFICETFSHLGINTTCTLCGMIYFRSSNPPGSWFILTILSDP